MAIPPYILKEICRNGTAEQRDRALATLSVDASLRLGRAEGAWAGRGGPAAAAPASRGPNRTIRDAGGTEDLDGAPVVRTETSAATADVAVTEAFDGLGATYAFWAEAFDRDSIDGAGLPLVGVVHYGRRYDNAFWDGTRMVFGDGDGQLFNRFTIALDIIGHELGHGVIEVEGPLRYSGESGALNESLADVFGSMVKQHQLGQGADDADWLIGAGLFTSAVKGRALRSMIAPGTAYDDPVLGTDPQPASMDGFVTTAADNGGVHINSGIPNRAFALAATAVGGPVWEGPGRVWFDALRSPTLSPTATFAQFAGETVRAAPAGSPLAEAVAAGWATMGVTPSASA